MSAVAGAERLPALAADAAPYGADTGDHDCGHHRRRRWRASSPALAAAEAGVSYEIFDRNDEVGGTWLTTDLPRHRRGHPVGVLLAVPRGEPDWSSYYPQGAEYQAYLVALADKYGLREHTRFHTEVEALWWDEDRQQWQIHSVDGRRQP